MSIKSFVALLLLAMCPAFALQGGPIQPDYMKFESADMPDMVNLHTGDFSYSIPLGVLPGPYGGFPLSMSYHAGISPQQEASWVGLGWTLNPGAINRTVRGVPDDQFHGGTLGFIYQYSAMSTWGLNIGWTNGLQSVGMTITSHGGVGFNATIGPSVGAAGSIGFDFDTQSGVGVSARAGGKVGPSIGGSLMFGRGGVSSSFDARYALHPGMSASVGVGFTPSGSVSKHAGFAVASEKGGPGVGLRVSGSGVQPSITYTPAGQSRTATNTISVAATGLSVSNVNTGNSTSKTTSKGFFIAAPVPNGLITLGFSTALHETWVRQATADYTYGYMYQAGPAVVADDASQLGVLPSTGTGTSTGGGAIPWTWNFQGRSLEYVGNPSGDLHPAYDLYSIASHGVSGLFRPYGVGMHSLHMSIRNNASNEDPWSQSYLLSTQADNNIRKQRANDFSSHWETVYPYTYKTDPNEVDRTLFAPNLFQPSDFISNDALIEQDLSPYAFRRTHYLNRRNRMVYLATPDDGDRVRSRMEFRFIGHNSGYFESEADDFTPGLDQNNLDPASPSMEVNSWKYRLLGSQRVEPILENNSPIGKLEGFRITSADGTVYMFTQPVRSLMKVDYMINQQFGVPYFVEQREKQNGFWQDFGNALLDFGKNILGLGILGGIGVLDNTWEKMFSGNLSEVCKDNNQNSDRLFSYQSNLNPYATQWLLKEVRGSDYIDLSTEAQPMVLGHHVRLNYTTPEVYKWRFPYAAPNTPAALLPNYRIPRQGDTPEGCGTNLYSASFGVKELVYLQSIETATHRVQFNLNDGNERRIDGKGWEMGTQSSSSSQIKSDLPLYTSATVKLEVVDLDQETVEEYTLPRFPTERACQREIAYKVNAIYVNTPLTDDVADGLIGRVITLYGIGNTFQVQLGGPLKAGYQINSENSAHDVRIASYTRVYGIDSKWGLYKIVPQNDIQISGRHGKSGVTCEDPNLLKTGGAGASDEDYLWIGENVKTNFASNTNYPSDWESAPYPLVDWLSVYQGTAEPPEGSHENEMRFLKSIAYCRRTSDDQGLCDPAETYSQFHFDYDYSMQPQTLNSYCSGKYPTTNQELSVIPQNLSVDACANVQSNSLFGKLTLNALTEEACRNGECAHLPPYQFGYNSPYSSTLRLGTVAALEEERKWTTSIYGGVLGDVITETMAASGSVGEGDLQVSQVNTNDQTDEWGLWSWTGYEENRKVNQDIADFAGSAWSLQKIVDPAGGVLEVEYERDSYHGDDFESEKRNAKIYYYGQCKSEYGTSNTDKTCLVLGPMHWKDDCLAGRPAYWEVGAKNGQAYEYLDSLGLATETPIVFNAAADFRTTVPCGLFGWSSCNRTRSAGTYGKADILEIAQVDKGVVSNNFSGVDINSLFGNETNARVVVLDVDWAIVEGGLYAGAKKINPNQAWSLGNGGRFGSLMVGREDELIKGGDIRVKKLIRHDMGLTQSTTYQYEFPDAAGVTRGGQIAQLPDSALTAQLATRSISAKINAGLPESRLSPKSRIVGIGDHDMNYLPDAKITYPRVRVSNTDQNNTTLNGYTEFSYVTPESGVPEEYVSEILDQLPAFTKVHLRIWTTDDASRISSRRMHVRAVDSQGRTKTLRVMAHTHEPNEYYFYSDNSFDATSVHELRFGDLDSEPKAYVEDRTVTINLDDESKYQEVWIAIRIKQRDPDCSASYFDIPLDEIYTINNLGIKAHKPGFVPVLYKKVEYRNTDNLTRRANKYERVFSTILCPFPENQPQKFQESFDTEHQIVYHDLSGFLGKQITTRFYREKNNESILIRKDSMVHAVTAPSISGAAPSWRTKLGQQKERWEYTKTMDCIDIDSENCRGKFPSIEIYGESELKKSITHLRYPSFVKEIITQTGFNTQLVGIDQETERVLTQKITNHNFDFLTGNPTVTAAHAPLGNGKEKRKITQTTPFWTLTSPTGEGIANRMFERNMVAQVFKEAVYSWEEIAENAPISLADANLRSVQVNPYAGVKSLGLPPDIESAITTQKEPIMALGAFKYRNLPSGFTGEWDNYRSQNPPLTDFDGIHIQKIDQYWKVREATDALGRSIASYYSSDGLLQTGLFYPATLANTLLWLPEGPSAALSSAGTPLSMGSIQNAIVELQVICTQAQTITATSGSIVQSVVTQPGRKSYRLEMGSTISDEITLSSTGASVQVVYVRVYPGNSIAKTYLYDRYGSMIQYIDEGNTSTYFEYDVFGNLVQTRNADGVAFKTQSREMMNGGNVHE